MWEPHQSQRREQPEAEMEQPSISNVFPSFFLRLPLSGDCLHREVWWRCANGRVRIKPAKELLQQYTSMSAFSWLGLEVDQDLCPSKNIPKGAGQVRDSALDRCGQLK